MPTTVPRAPAVAGERDLPPDGVGGSKHLPRGELADDEDARRARPIAIVEAASAKDLDSERPEDRRRRGDRGDHARRRVRRAGLFRRRHRETQRARHAEGQSARERRRFDRRMAAPFAEQTIERPPRARLLHSGRVEIEDRDPDPIQIDAGVVRASAI